MVAPESQDDTEGRGVDGSERIYQVEAGTAVDGHEPESDRGFRVEGNVVSVNSAIA